MTFPDISDVSDVMTEVLQAAERIAKAFSGSGSSSVETTPCWTSLSATEMFAQIFFKRGLFDVDDSMCICY